MERSRIIVKGDVQMVGFRGFVIKQMKSLKLKGEADNLSDGTVKVLCEGEKDKINELIVGIKETPPHFARVDSVEPEWQEYLGDLKEPDRGGEDVPKRGATLDDLLKVMQSFDNKAEILNERVGDVASNTGSIISNTGGMASDMKDMASDMKGMAFTLKEFKEESGEKQDQMLDKQDQTIESINKGFTETKQDFTTLRDDYGKISQNMREINQNIEKLTEAILKLAEKSG